MKLLSATGLLTMRGHSVQDRSSRFAVGIYVNHKPTAVRHFMSEYGHLDSAAILPELQDLWQ